VSIDYLPDEMNAYAKGMKLPEISEFYRGWRAACEAMAAKAQAKAPPGHIIDDQGNVRKVLGTLPITADGCVIGKKAYLWGIFPGLKGRDDDKPMRVCYKPCPIMDPDQYTDGPTQMFSTRAAAEAARGTEGSKCG
jgi:hypothetical protein